VHRNYEVHSPVCEPALHAHCFGCVLCWVDGIVIGSLNVFWKYVGAFPTPLLSSFPPCFSLIVHDSLKICLIKLWTHESRTSNLSIIHVTYREASMRQVQTSTQFLKLPYCRSQIRNSETRHNRQCKRRDRVAKRSVKSWLWQQNERKKYWFWFPKMCKGLIQSFETWTEWVRVSKILHTVTITATQQKVSLSTYLV